MDSGLLALLGIFGGIGLLVLYLWALTRAPRVVMPKGLTSAWRFRSKEGLRVIAKDLAATTRARIEGEIQAGHSPRTTAAVICTPPGPVRLRIDVVDKGFPGVPYVAILSRTGPWIQIELRGSRVQLFPGQSCKRRQALLLIALAEAGLSGMQTPELQVRQGQGPWLALNEN